MKLGSYSPSNRNVMGWAAAGLARETHHNPTANSEEIVEYNHRFLTSSSQSNDRFHFHIRFRVAMTGQCGVSFAIIRSN